MAKKKLDKKITKNVSGGFIGETYVDDRPRYGVYNDYTYELLGHYRTLEEAQEHARRVAMDDNFWPWPKEANPYSEKIKD